MRYLPETADDGEMGNGKREIALRDVRFYPFTIHHSRFTRTSHMKSDFRARNHPAYWAFVVHRASGVLLSFFLLLHFWTLGLALESEAALESFLRWSDQPLVKLAETVLVVLLAAHMAGGARLLALEFLPWRDWQKNLLALATGVSLAAGLGFALNVF
jgi:fumarate reductase subunit D